MARQDSDLPVSVSDVATEHSTALPPGRDVWQVMLLPFKRQSGGLPVLVPPPMVRVQGAAAKSAAGSAAWRMRHELPQVPGSTLKLPPGHGLGEGVISSWRPHTPRERERGEKA